MPGYGMTLQERHKLDLARSIMNQLGATEEILKSWETEKYPADGDVVAKFWTYVRNAPAVCIVGDYDCDGICATHIMEDSVKENFPEKEVVTRIPKRFSEGYGIKQVITDEIKATMPKGTVVITVDNGIAAADCLEDLEANGYVVLMTDHHELREGNRVPKVTMTIDPTVEEIPNPLEGRYWCGAAVAYKICEPFVSEELAKEISIYAGIATVADCMPLKEGNWGLVRNTIKEFRKDKAPECLCDLLYALKQDPKFCKEDYFGFYLGPAFNAAGRILDDGASKVLDYLREPSKEKCKELKELNDQRKELKEEGLAIIHAKIEREGLDQECPMWIEVDGLKPGIVGVLAGNIAEEYKRPVIVLTNDDNGNYKGSSRGYGDFDIFKYLSAIPINYVSLGGHPGAAGLTLRKEDFDFARSHQLEFTEEEKNVIRMKIRNFEIPGLCNVLGKFAPYGQGNEAPIFEVEVNLNQDQCEVKKAGAEQTHLFLSDNSGKWYQRWEIKHFNHYPNTLSNNEHFGMRGKITNAAWQGRETPTLNVDEAFDIDEENGSREENVRF